MGSQCSTNGNSSPESEGTGKEIFVDIFNEEFYDRQVDALVCYIDTNWSQDDSFNKDLIEKGGNQFISKRQTLHEHYLGNCQIGDVFPCHGGKLPCKKVFFCVVPNQMDDGQAEAGGDINGTLAAIFEKVLETSASSGFRSLALPFGTGDLCPHPSMAIPMLYMNMLKLQNCRVMNIHLVTFDSGIVDLMNKVLRECHQTVPTECQELEHQAVDGQKETMPQISDETHEDESGNEERGEYKTENLVNQSDNEVEEFDDESDEELQNNFNQNHQAEADPECESSQLLDKSVQQQSQTVLSCDTDSSEQMQHPLSPAKSSESSVDPDIVAEAVTVNLPVDVDNDEDDDEDDDDCQKIGEQHLLNPWDGVCTRGSLIRKEVTFSSEVTERHLGEGDEILVEFKRSESLSSVENEPLDFDNLRTIKSRTSENNLEKQFKEKSELDGTTNASSEESFVCPICLQQYPVSFEKKLDKCEHVFCRDCINQHLSVKRCCPICNVSYGTRIGTQPLNALMSYKVVSGSLPGYDGSDTILIEYDIPDGIQTEEHPNPGKPYKGTQRTAYLPNTPDGQRILKLLQKAFDQRLTFTVGKSLTTGRENVVTWNDIHHKTNINGGQQRFGYPDPTYLRRVYDELQQKGVTED